MHSRWNRICGNRNSWIYSLKVVCCTCFCSAFVAPIFNIECTSLWVIHQVLGVYVISAGHVLIVSIMVHVLQAVLNSEEVSAKWKFSVLWNVIIFAPCNGQFTNPSTKNVGRNLILNAFKYGWCCRLNDFCVACLIWIWCLLFCVRNLSIYTEMLTYCARRLVVRKPFNVGCKFQK